MLKLGKLPNSNNIDISSSICLYNRIDFSKSSLLKKLFRISQEDLRVSIRIYEDLDRNKCLQFWSKITGTSVNDFVSVNVLKGKKKGNKLNKDKIIEISENLLSRKGDLYTLKVIGEESKYDLLFDSLLSFKLIANIKDKHIVSSTFYREVKLIYLREERRIKNILRR